MTGWSRRRLLVGATVLLLAIALVGTAVGALLQWREAAAVATARDEGLAAAVDTAPKVLDYDYRTPPDVDRQVADLTTGDFSDDYRTLFSQYLTPNARTQQFVTRVTVRDRSVVSAAPDQVVAMLFLSQVTTSTALTAPRLDSSAVRMTLTYTDGRWRVAGLERV